jgi:hypothetical protein
MTEDEFLQILPPEWHVSQGKVDWYKYAPGKVSKEYVPESIALPK